MARPSGGEAERSACPQSRGKVRMRGKWGLKKRAPRMMRAISHARLLRAIVSLDDMDMKKLPRRAH